VDDGVELFGKASLEVMADALAFGLIDDTDGAFEQRLGGAGEF
jgi:hypothetical protein